MNAHLSTKGGNRAGSTVAQGATVKLIHCIPPTNQLTRREQELRKRIEGTVLLMAANDGTDIDEEELKRRVFTEEASKKIYVLTKSVELDLITKYVWDMGLTGGSNKRTIEALYRECQLGATAIARRDKIMTKVKSVYRTYRETRALFQDESQNVKQLAERAYKLLNCFKQRVGSLEALEAHGVYVRK